MKTLSFAGLALVLTALPGAAFAQGDSATGAGVQLAALTVAADNDVPVIALMPKARATKAPKVIAAPASAAPVSLLAEEAGATFGVPTTMPATPMPTTPMPRGGGRNWGPRPQGRWIGGWNAPGGWGAYRRPFSGYVVPTYWISPSFLLGNYGMYGFSRPSMGYNWYRYYDDAVLVDRYGRVSDSVYGYNWGQYDSYDDGGYAAGPGYGPQPGYGYPQPGYGYPQQGRAPDRDGGLGGAAIGAVTGALGGAIIGGRGNRGAGALIGGGIGALAGAIIDSKDNAGRGYGPGGAYPGGMSKKEYKRWRKAQRNGGYGYPAGYPAGYPGGYGYGYGYGAYGGGCPATQTIPMDSVQNGSISVPNVPGCVTTVTVNPGVPVTTSHTSYVTETVYTTVRKPVRRRVYCAPARKPVRHYRPRTQCAVQGS